jgi:hypothetical protein
MAETSYAQLLHELYVGPCIRTKMTIDTMPNFLVGGCWQFFRSQAPLIQTLLIWHPAQNSAEKSSPFITSHGPLPSIVQQLGANWSAPFLNVLEADSLQSADERFVIHTHEKVENLEIRFGIV